MKKSFEKYFEKFNATEKKSKLLLFKCKFQKILPSKIDKGTIQNEKSI